MRKAIAAAFLLAQSVIAATAWAQQTYTMRASLDTSATHARTVSVADYLKTLEQRSGGRIKTELFHSGALFRDRDVAKALRQGAIEMAVPGSWVLTGFVPDADIFDLPCLFGRSLPVNYAIADGKAGQMIDGELTKKLDVVVLGPWLPLGYNNVYTTSKPINSFDDLKGLKIRNSGGAGQSLRTRFFGAQPNVTAWPDVPLALSQGTFDGLDSTNESLVSAKLWESGVRYGFLDKEWVGYYVPLVSQSFYDKLPADLQKLVTDTWRDKIGGFRSTMENAQEQAAKTLGENGVKLVQPTDEQLAAMRKQMMPKMDEWAKDLRITPAMLAIVKPECEKPGS